MEMQEFLLTAPFSERPVLGRFHFTARELYSFILLIFITVIQRDDLFVWLFKMQTDRDVDAVKIYYQLEKLGEQLEGFSSFEKAGTIA